MHISIEEALKHLFASLENSNTNFVQDILIPRVAEFSTFGGPLTDTFIKTFFDIKICVTKLNYKNILRI